MRGELNQRLAVNGPTLIPLLSSADLIFLALFGILGVLARRGKFDLAPMVLAFILRENQDHMAAAEYDEIRPDRSRAYKALVEVLLR